uniref:Macrophage receptor with collagenous structure n=1 Tax=Nannospalax galili TaxID=1026970 RepID=A0A8C6WBX7_NANGA
MGNKETFKEEDFLGSTEEGANLDQAVPHLSSCISDPQKPKKRSGGNFCMVVIVIHLILLTVGAALLAFQVLNLQEQLWTLQKNAQSRLVVTEEKPKLMPLVYPQRQLALGSPELRVLQDQLTQIHHNQEQLIHCVNSLTRNPELFRIKGEQGSSGKGPPGAPGTPGLPRRPAEKGDKGAVGHIGAPGVPGPQGLPGIKGEEGKGLTGAPGEPGVFDNLGPQREKGSKGDRGLLGSRGEYGAKGERGYPVLPGKGDMGMKGNRGDMGLPGAWGNKGGTGILGLPGKQPHVGGPQGITGPPGTVGPLGAKGEPGLIGHPGLTGECLISKFYYPLPFLCVSVSGIQGQKGVKGDSGFPGLEGRNGDTGNPGLTGSKREPGLVGLKGDPGVKGSSGEQGENGEDWIRIADGTNRGRAEVYHNNAWGTICDDGWDDNDATVFCRMMGYSRGRALIRYGGGSGNIWMDNVQCRGTEFSIWRCRKRDWGSHNCSHSEDAGVECS